MALAGNSLKPGIKKYVKRLIRMRDWAKRNGLEEDRRMLNGFIREAKSWWFDLKRRRDGN